MNIFIGLLILYLIIQNAHVAMGYTYTNFQKSSNNIMVYSWAIQLQHADIDEISSSGFSLVVIDYSYDGSESSEYDWREIQRIKSNGVIPIAYISIGEAENYRFYWNDSWNQNPPEWLGRENPDWEGNYAVKYWYREWKEIIFTYIDKIIAQGFMGLYLDKVDEFEYWSDPENGEDTVLSEKKVAVEMIKFIDEIAHYCRNEKNLSDFMIIPQNGERLLDYDTNGTLIETISGIGVEDLFYGGLNPVPSSLVMERTKYLDEIKLHGKLVLSVDYVDDGTGYNGKNKERIDDYIRRARKRGYIPYAALEDRGLDELNIIKGIQPYRHFNGDNWIRDARLVLIVFISSQVILAGFIMKRKRKTRKQT